MERALLVGGPQRSALEAVGGSHGEQTTHQDVPLEAESPVLGGTQAEMCPGFLRTLGLLLSTVPPSPEQTCSPQTRADPPSYPRSPPPLEQ